MENRDIWVYNKGRYEREQIPAEKLMRLIYENPMGRATLPFLIKRKVLSRLYGIYCRSTLSKGQISRFINDYQIDMTGCVGTYRNFSEFFSRERKNVVFPEESALLGSPCEGLVSAYTDIVPEKLIAAKGSYFSLSELFGDKILAEEYRGGAMLSIRLTPANYHRMHFFDNGKVTETRFLNGDLFSVNPLAIRQIARLYCRNKRAMILFSSQNFKNVVIVEVGATFVGSIMHCFKEGDLTQRGQQASYFLPGGSLVLIFFQKGTFVPKEILVTQTKKNYETKISLGDVLGSADVFQKSPGRS